MAREPRERLDCLKEMLRTIPRHKGTEHLQADIKSRIRELTEEIGGTHVGTCTPSSHACGASRRCGADMFDWCTKFGQIHVAWGSDGV